MKRSFSIGLGIGLLTGLAFAWTAEGKSYSQSLSESTLDAGDGTAFTIPPSYGQLVDVAVSSEVHHLYFQDSAGVIRIVLLGPRGATQKARHTLELVSPRIYLIERQEKVQEEEP